MKSLFNALRLQVEIEGLSEHIVARLVTRQDVLAEEIELALTRAVESIDVQAMVDRIAEPAVKKAVELAVDGACLRLSRDPKFRKALYKSVQAALVRGNV